MLVKILVKSNGSIVNPTFLNTKLLVTSATTTIIKFNKEKSVSITKLKDHIWWLAAAL